MPTDTRTRVRTAHPAEPGACRCPHGRPVLIATFEAQVLTDVRRRHWPAQCGLPAQVLDPAAFGRGRR